MQFYDKIKISIVTREVYFLSERQRCSRRNETLDDPFIVLFKLLSVFFLVFLNAFFVAAEFAMVKIRETRIQQLVDEGNIRARFAKKLTDNLDAYLSACQLGITLASLGLGWIGEPAVARIIEPVLVPLGLPDQAIHTIAFFIAFSFITMLHIVLGELMPKSLAIRLTEPTVLWVAPPMVWFHRIMYPFIWLLNGLANALLKAVGLGPMTGEDAHTEEEILRLIKKSQKQGLITLTEASLVDNVFDFAERVAKDIMVPRTDMVVLDTEIPFEENLRIIEREKYTRYPVCKRDKDHIIGLVHIKDVYHMVLSGQKDLTSILREHVTVPEAMPISAVLSLLQRKHAQMAIVMDEYGGTAGLLTVEDILEELVGDIQDEYDQERPEIENIDRGYSVDGRMRLKELEELLHLSIDAPDIDTIGGWVFTQLKKPPEVGDVVQWNQLQFEVKEMDGSRIERIWIRWPEPQAEPEWPDDMPAPVSRIHEPFPAVNVTEAKWMKTTKEEAE